LKIIQKKYLSLCENKNLKSLIMKRIIYFFGLVIVLPALFHSCGKDEEFDETLLYGKWKSGTLFYKYSSDHKGATWDTSDHVTEDEAQPFTWTLVKSDLEQIHIMEMGGNVPKYYTVTELTATTLKYKDDYKSYSFTKVN
jgi:hypothetical protein